MRFGGGNGSAWQREPRRVRALFVSDLHLGSRTCKSERFIDFLRHHRAEAIYLVGDIVDGWRLSSNWYWPDAYDDVVQELLRAASDGCRIVYVPGNHDAFLRDYCGIHFGGIEVVDRTIHVGADGRRYLVVHGDSFDGFLKRASRFAGLGDRAEAASRALSFGLNLMRRQFNLPQLSVSRWAKRKVRNAVRHVSIYEEALTKVAHRHRADGVICGHIHHPAMRDDLGVLYINCGDWVESCTAAVEHDDGCFEIVTWAERVPDAGEVPAAAEARAA